MIFWYLKTFRCGFLATMVTEGDLYTVCAWNILRNRISYLLNWLPVFLKILHNGCNKMTGIPCKGNCNKILQIIKGCSGCSFLIKTLRLIWWVGYIEGKSSHLVVSVESAWRADINTSRAEITCVYILILHCYIFTFHSHTPLFTLPMLILLNRKHVYTYTWNAHIPILTRKEKNV